MDGIVKNLEDELLTREEAARHFKVSVKTFCRWHIAKVRLPGRGVRYRKEDIDAYVRSRLEYPAPKPAKRCGHVRTDRGLPSVIGLKELLTIKGADK